MPAFDSDRVRELLEHVHLGQSEAAEVLEISDREMRRYACGEKPVPRVVILALARLVDLERLEARQTLLICGIRRPHTAAFLVRSAESRSTSVHVGRL